MKIENSLDWQDVHTKLRKQIITVGYNPDLSKMLDNITKMVSELSKLEVEARRVRKTYMIQDTIDYINKAIDHLEKLLLIAQLMR